MEKTIQYTTQKATVADIFNHLKKCDDSFVPALSQRVNLEDYAQKLFEKACCFEAWNNHQELVGLIAAYLNETPAPSAFISNVSTDQQFMGKGIASQLLKNCINHLKENNCFEIYLDVNEANEPAIRFYKKNHFIQTDKKGEQLILKLEIK